MSTHTTEIRRMGPWRIIVNGRTVAIAKTQRQALTIKAQRFPYAVVQPREVVVTTLAS